MRLEYEFDLPPYHEDGRKRGEHEPQSLSFEYEIHPTADDYAEFMCPSKKPEEYCRGFEDGVIEVLTSMFSLRELEAFMEADGEFCDYMRDACREDAEKEFWRDFREWDSM